MASSKLNTTPTYHMQLRRFTKHPCLRLWDLSSSLCGKIAVSGYHCNTKQTFIDLYWGGNSNFMDTFELYYSEKFEKYSNYCFRYCSFLENDWSKIVTCIGDHIEIIDTKNKTEESKSRKVNCEIASLGVRANEIVLVLDRSQTLVILNEDLIISETIDLTNIKNGSWPCRLEVTLSTVCVLTEDGGALSIVGSVSTEYTNSAKMYSNAHSITVSESLGLVAILWGWDQIMFYLLNENKSVLVLDVNLDVFRIRISDRNRLMMTADFWTGEIKMYDLEELFTYHHMMEHLSVELKKEECVMLTKIFRLRKKYSDLILNSETPGQSLLHALEEEAILQPSNVSALANALMTISTSCFKIITIYQKTRGNYKMNSTNSERVEPFTGYEEIYDTSEMGFEELSSDLIERIEVLRGHLEQSIRQSALLEKDNKELKTELLCTQQSLNQDILDKDAAWSEFQQYQLNSSKERRKLEENLNQMKQAMVKLQQEAAEGTTKDNFSNIRLRDTTYPEVPMLSAEFRRLIVGIADSLTLDHSLKLGLLFDLPPAVSDMLCRISLFQSPGLKLLDELKDRNIINMYDITNLHKALRVLELDELNSKLVQPYEEKIDDEHYALHKTKEIFTWAEVNSFLDAKKCSKTMPKSNSSLVPPKENAHRDGLKEKPQAEPTTNTLGTEVKETSIDVKGRLNFPYIEHSIDKEGGTIHLAGVHLTIPSEALLLTQVIGMSVTNDPHFRLPTEFDKTRMTPLIKLEPLGFKLKKPIQLVIEHYALIPEPERHDAIIYSGHTSTNKNELSDITWTEERSLPRQLKENSVIVDIQCLSYFSASLVSGPSAPTWHIVRALTFIDGVRSADDDITLTVCFCSDNEFEYNMLLSDYRKKLALEKYSTLYLIRHSGNSASNNTLKVTVSSINNKYLPDTDQATKIIAFPHLCSASRVSHQFRLKKNQAIDSDVVDVKLTLSQHNSTEIFLKAKIKDLIISQETEDHLTGCLPPALKPYEDLKAKVSSQLEKDHCRKLAHYFELSPAEADSVNNDSAPGVMLIKILDQREKIMPQKMIDLFHGLKDCHLDKIARMVLKYIDDNSEQAQQEQRQEIKPTEEIRKFDSILEHPRKEQQATLSLNSPKRVACSSRSERSVKTTIFSSITSSDAHAKKLMKEGYTEYDVLEALEVSTNRLVLARRLLKSLSEPLVVLPERGIFLYKEQYIDEKGGDVNLPEGNICMKIPAGAISRGSIVNIMVLMGKHGKIPLEESSPRLTPVIKLGQEGLPLHKRVKLTIPHCAEDAKGITATYMYLGYSKEGKGIEWRKQSQDEPRPLPKKHHFEVLMQQFCAVNLNVDVDYQKPFGKRLRILPLISRILSTSDDLTITVIVYNDDETEHLHIVHEQTGVEGKLQLHDFKRFTLKGFEEEKEVHITSEHNKVTPYLNTGIKKILVSRLLQNTSHGLEFHFQNNEQISDISFKLRLCTRNSMDDDLQFDLKIKLTDLLQKPNGSARGLLKRQSVQPAMEKSFQDLILELSTQFSVALCLEIARVFCLSTVLRDRIEKSSEPGNILLEELIHEQLISAYHLSALDVALTRTGDVHLAEIVKEYRRKNVTASTTIFSLY